MFLDVAVQSACSAVGLPGFPNWPRGFGSADIHSQINPAGNGSVAAPHNQLWGAEMEMIKIHIWTFCDVKGFWEKQQTLAHTKVS